MNAKEIESKLLELVPELKYSVELIGETTRDSWHCDAWRVQLRAQGQTVEFEYYTGLGHRAPKSGRPVAPKLADVVCALLRDSSAIGQSFDDWCAEYDYSNDSIKALDTYLACQREGTKLRAVFGDLEQLQPLFEDY